MLFKTLEELQAATLTPREMKECFKFLIKLIIHEKNQEARDYTWQLAEAILRTMQEENRQHKIPPEGWEI